jgi:hypothetical protein
VSNLPATLAFAIRSLKLLLGFFLIAPVVHFAEHVSNHDAAQRLDGALTLLLLFWFLGLLKDDEQQDAAA